MISTRNATGFYGVYHQGGKFRGMLWNPHTHELLYLGVFRTAELAAAVVDRACATLKKAPYAYSRKASCRYGHVLTPENRIPGNGRCRRCHREACRDYQRMKRQTDAAWWQRQLAYRRAFMRRKRATLKAKQIKEVA